MSAVITRIRQVDGSVRIVLAQDLTHAGRAREILRRNPAMIDHLDGIDGIHVEVIDGEHRAVERAKREGILR